MQSLMKTARKKLLSYIAVKSHVLLDSTRQTVVVEDSDLKESAWFLMCSLYGTVYEDDCVDEIVASIELCNEHLIGEIVRPWASEPESSLKTMILLTFLSSAMMLYSMWGYPLKIARRNISMPSSVISVTSSRKQ